MAAATITSKGQVTIPKDVREELCLRAGVRIDFLVQEDGTVLMRPLTRKIEEVYGILARPGQRPVSVEEMDEGIRRYLRKKHRKKR